MLLVVGGAVASFLEYSNQIQAVRVWAMAMDILLRFYMYTFLYSHSSSLHPGVKMGSGILDESC